MPPYLGRVVVMQHLGKSMDFFRGMCFFYFCSVVQPFFDLADAGGTETGFYLLHIMQRVAYAQPVDGKVTVLAEYFITGQRIVQIAELDKEGFPQASSVRRCSISLKTASRLSVSSKYSPVPYTSHRLIMAGGNSRTLFRMAASNLATGIPFSDAQ